MKMKEKIIQQMAGSRKQEARSRKHEAGRQETGAGSNELKAGSYQQAAGSESKMNSTVYQNKSQFQKDSRAIGKNHEGNELVRLASVIIDISREEAAITACDLLRIFNN